MKILNRHIAETIIYATLFVLLLLVGLQVFIGFVSALGDIGTGNYNLWQATIYVIRMLPLDVYDFFPMASLLGSLLGLGYLATHSELIVMRASGMTLRQIMYAIFQAAVLMLIVMTFLGEVIAPKLSQEATLQKAVAMSKVDTLKTLQGVWLRDGQRYVRIDSLLPGRELNGVNEYRFDDSHHLISIRYAKTAIHKDHHWILQNVVETQFKGNKPTVRHYTSLPWTIKINTTLLKLTQMDSRNMSLFKLIALIHYRRVSGLQSQPYELELWQRIFQPLSILVMIFLAIPFVFGPLRSSPMGLGILVGVAIGFSFYLLDRFFGPFSLVYQLPPFLGALIPLVLFFGVGLFLMRKVR